jgi:hypothetical protein
MNGSSPASIFENNASHPIILFPGNSAKYAVALSSIPADSVAEDASVDPQATKEIDNINTSNKLNNFFIIYSPYFL